MTTVTNTGGEVSGPAGESNTFMKPPPLAVLVENLPPVLTSLPRWVSWRYVADGQGWRKVPKDCKTGRNARVTDPASWSTFDLARATLGRRKRDRHDGVGFVLNGDGLVGIDLDECRDPTTGVVEGWAQDVIRQLDTYSELSPSGTGVKLLLYGTLPPRGRRAGAIEMYSDRRFFTLTGHRLAGTSAGVMARGEHVLDLHRRVFPPRRVGSVPTGVFPLADEADDDVVAALLAGGDGRVRQLMAGDDANYASPSEADLALCGFFARAVGPNPARVERLFGRSGLAGRDKWRAAPDYRRRTVERAVHGLSEYDGRRATITLAKSFQEYAESSITQWADGGSEAFAEVGATPSAIDDAKALAHEQKGRGNNFNVTFNLARRLLRHGEHPEPFADAVRVFCEEAGRDYDEFWVEFLWCWPKVRSAEGSGGWAWAEAAAVERPVEFLPGAGWAVNRAATLAYHLSLLTSPFPFPVEKVGAACGMSAMMGSKLTQLLAERKVINQVKKPNRFTREAAEYVFLAPFPSAEGGNAASVPSTR